ncbi:acyltransferase family protein [Flexithrix dorotheae]|uniref:acyltransferase family protein n=1 Tax=Flexithrix dorotheae TaxID=70993 RepID=UPI000367AA06|nr:acyltransferase [Flexithrix dorotheae]
MNQFKINPYKKKKVFFENLDGLRFFCFIAVYFFHSFHTEKPEILQSDIYLFITKDLFGNGNLGVNFFFVLSGFLITYLLIVEKKINGQINLKKFWIRRILRIWPLFFFCVIFGFVIFPQLKLLFGQSPNESANFLFYITFLNNFDLIKNGLPDASILGVLWSVAIEEQFYLIWPIVLYIFPIKKFWIPFSLVIISSLVFRAFNDNYMLHEYHTLSCIGDMTVGALGAWVVSEFPSIKVRIENFGKIHILSIYLLFFTIFIFRDEIFFGVYFLRVFERITIAFVILLIILEQNYAKNSYFKLSRFRTISKLGGITYGLYCLHFIGILITITLTKKLSFNNHLWQVIIFESLIALAITIIISKVSYTFFEKPFLRIKNKFSYISRD